jgi:hypothetical protein
VLHVDPAEIETNSFYPVAAFPLETVRAGYDFVVYHKCQTSNGGWRIPNLRGVIREEDLRGWR